MANEKTIKPIATATPRKVSDELLERLREIYGKANAARAELGKVCYTVATLKSRENELINAIANLESEFSKELSIGSQKVGFDIKNIDLETGEVR